MRSGTPEHTKNQSSYDSSSDEGESLCTDVEVPDNRLYVKLILYAGGHCLALLFGLLVYSVWLLLQDYRDAIIWALLCSLPLRNCKNFLVQFSLAQLLQDRSLFAIGVDLVCLPLQVLKASILDAWQFFYRWRKFTFEYEAQFKERARTADQQLRDSQAMAEAQSSSHQPKDPRVAALAPGFSVNQGTSQSTPRSTSKAKRPRRPRKTSRLPAFLGGLVEIGHLGFKAWRSDTPEKAPLPQAQPPSPSQHSSHSLFRALLVACLFYQLFIWLHNSWSSILHVLLLTGTAFASVSLLPFLYLAAHLYLSMASPEPAQQTLTTDGSQSLPAAGEDAASVDGGRPQVSQLAAQRRPSRSFDRLRRLYTRYREIDAKMRVALASCIHSLVAAWLVVALLVGAFLLVVFISVRIGQESRVAVMAATDAARSWTALPQSTTELALRKSPWQMWLSEQQARVGQLVEESLPNAASWAESQISKIVDAYNLTQAVEDIKALYATMVPLTSCTNHQKEQYLIALALGASRAQQANEQHAYIEDQITRTKELLHVALQDWEYALPKNQSVINSQAKQHAELQMGIVNLDRQLRHLEQEHIPAHSAMDDANEIARRAERDLEKCLELLTQPPARESNLVQQLGQKLQGAYAHLWNLQIHDGLADLKIFAGQVLELGSQLLQGEGDSKEANAVERLARAAADPLISLGRHLAGVLATSTISTTTLAFSGGLGVLKLGVGLLKFGVQMIVFLALLFYLLAAESDPLTPVARLLPLSAAARQRASTAFSSAMRGVIVCAIKLSAFHALFTWLSFSIFSVHLVYMSTVASAVFALLPFIPSWLVSLPAVAQLALLQDRPMAALLLLLLHFGAWYIADDLILREIPSSHPYLTGLGIFGGIATFSNPLQGAIFGPMALSMLSVMYNLHMASQQTPTPGSRTATPGSSGLISTM